MSAKRKIPAFGPAGPFIRQMQTAARSWTRHNSNMMSAALAYYATCSLFPAVLLLISILAVAHRLSSGVQDAQQQLLTIVAGQTSAAVADHLHNALDALHSGASVSGPLGGVLLAIMAMGVFANIENACDRIFGTEGPAEHGIWPAISLALFRRLRAFLMLMCVGSFVILLLVGGLVSSALYRYADGLEAGYFWKLFQISVTILLNWLLFTLLYKFLPRVPIRWRDALKGGALMTLLWEVSRHVLAFVLLSKKYSAYGVVGSLLALILWLYVSNAILLFAAEYVRVLRDERGTKPGQVHEEIARK